MCRAKLSLNVAKISNRHLYSFEIDSKRLFTIEIIKENIRMSTEFHETFGKCKVRFSLNLLKISSCCLYSFKRFEFLKHFDSNRVKTFILRSKCIDCKKSGFSQFFSFHSINKSGLRIFRYNFQRL